MRALTWYTLGFLLFLPHSADAGGAATPHVAAHTSPESRSGWIGALRGNRNYTSTISGTAIRSTDVVVDALSYDGACADMSSGTYLPPTVPLSEFESAKTKGFNIDNCDTSANDCQTYKGDLLSPHLWRTVGIGDTDCPCPPPLFGSRSLWCGTPLLTAQNTVVPGYPNSYVYQPQMLYVDTGAHASAYELTFQMQFSCASDDHIYLIGGGGGVQDPIGIDWVKVAAIISQGPQSGSELLVVWTGSFTSDQTVNLSTAPLPKFCSGSTTANSPAPTTRLMTIQQIPAAHRALYFIFIANGQRSTEDGLWPSTSGQGQLIDNLRVSDNGDKYVDAGPTVPCSDPNGIALSCNSSTSALEVSSRTQADAIAMGFSPRILSAGAPFTLQPGNGLSNADVCSPEKSSPFDLIWTVANPTVPAGTTAGLEQCVFPVPAGTTSLIASWRHYLDLPEGDGYVQVTEYRFFKGGVWSTWRNSSPSGGAQSGPERAWETESDELTDAAQADSVQMRFWIQCVPALSAGQQSCPSIPVGIYYDSFGLWAFINGVPAPTFGLFPGLLAQTTFVDGTMTGPPNCTSPPCWPGVRGTALTPAAGGIDDNVNSPVGDSLVVFLRSPFRRNGMGLNWRFGYDKSSPFTGTVHTNASYNATFGEPRMIYRLFDPATKTWGPFDSTALDANDVRVSPTDTALVDNAFRMDWPPRDKAGLNLPGGFTINGIAAYSSLSFLPRGTRLQYYVKAVDLVGNVAYQFQADAAAYEVQDLPTLPGGSAKAPDIMEFDVLPRVYPPGSPGSLLAGKTNTPVLNLDGAYTSWSFSQDPVTQALLGLGVRADRYRLQQAVGYGNNIGGHELTVSDGQIPNRPTNYFPNMNEYGIRESLSTWYRIVIQSSHLHTLTTDDESDARLLDEWWSSSTPGTSGGDRCLFVSGDDYFNTLLHANPADPSPRRVALAQNVLGVSTATGSWNGTGSVPYPVIDDRFTAPGAIGQPGVPLAALGYNYPSDGGCLGPNRFDALTKIGSSDAQNAAFYPPFSGMTNVAAVAMQTEKDPVTDKDRSKALSYGYSLQLVRKTGIPASSPSYAHSGVQERMQILYKFLASCRGARSGAPADTGKCWPCPTDANMTGNWASLAGFQTGQYGPLYPVQDNAAVTYVDEGTAPGARNVLGQNRPNPFNPTTVIPYSTAAPGKVAIRIYDVGGRLIRTIEDGSRPAGEHSAHWDGRLQSGAEASSGVYFYRIEYPGGGVSSKKMILLR